MGNPAENILAVVTRRHAEQSAQARELVRQLAATLEAPLELSAQDLAPLLPAAAPSAAPPLASLRGWIQAIDEDRNQVNVLKTLLQAAHEYAKRVSLFVVRGDTVSGWAALGFSGDGTATDERVKSVTIPLAADTVLRLAIQSVQGYAGPATAQAQNAQLFEALGAVVPRELCAHPLVNKGRVAAVLYADSGSSPQLGSSDAIEILARAAAMSIELIPVRGPATPRAAASAPAAPAEAARPAAPAPRPTAPVGAPAPPSPAPAAASAAGADLSRLSAEDQQLHKSAMRFARLLVSEIKLYHPEKVTEGRKNKDLYARLREDIDRSKQMYEKKVNPKIAQSTNYFYDELLKALAEGDASALAGYTP